MGAICFGLASCERYEQKSDGEHHGHAFVDLGLPSGTMWATCNVGGKHANDKGQLFSWGEIATKKEFTVDNYKWKDENCKYKKADAPQTLEFADDAARQIWGGNWRIPTQAEWSELGDNCDFEWDDNFFGCKITGPNGNSIFLNAGGTDFILNSMIHGYQGYYWSATNSAKNSYDAVAMAFKQIETSVQVEAVIKEYPKCEAFTVRAVFTPAK